MLGEAMPGRPRALAVPVVAGRLDYRCRRCGLVHPGWEVPDLAGALVLVTQRMPLPESWGPTAAPEMTTVHDCADGRLGVSDLIGGAPRTPAPEIRKDPGRGRRGVEEGSRG